jgi:hypothetical protein
MSQESPERFPTHDRIQQDARRPRIKTSIKTKQKDYHLKEERKKNPTISCEQESAETARERMTIILQNDGIPL